MPRQRSRLGRTVRGYADALLVAVLLALFVRTFVAQAFRISSSSMSASLLAGDHILVDKMTFAPTGRVGEALAPVLPMRAVRRGDVVVFRAPLAPRRQTVKRCVATAGDVVEIVDKKLTVNSRPVDESAYVRRVDPRVFNNSRFLDERMRHRDNFGPYRVPSGHLFVLGDNRDRSSDSRRWGAIPIADLDGRAWLIYWSTAAGAPGATRDKIAMSGLWSRLASTRWDRCLRPIR